MEVRPATREDADAIVVELWKPFAEEMAALDPFDELAEDVLEPARSYRKRLLDRDDVGMWVATSSDAYVGLATVERQASPPVFARGDAAHIHELYVAPPERGSGIADRLLDRARAWAQERSCTHLSLDVNVANERARSFYLERGFEPKREQMVRRL